MGYKQGLVVSWLTGYPVCAMRMHALLGIVSLACIMVLMPSFTDRTQPVRVSPIPRPTRSERKDVWHGGDTH
jgi:hypothetical protein